MPDNHRAIRIAQPGDAPAIAALVGQAYEPWVAIVGRRPRPMDDDFTKRCAAGQAYMLEAEGELLGIVVIEDMQGHLFLHNVAVTPSQHGQGIGRELLVFVEKEARKRGFSEVQLTTLEGMARNVSLYLRIGYVITERVKAGNFDRLTMVKRLA